MQERSDTSTLRRDDGSRGGTHRLASHLNPKNARRAMVSLRWHYPDQVRRVGARKRPLSPSQRGPPVDSVGDSSGFLVDRARRPSSSLAVSRPLRPPSGRPAAGCQAGLGWGRKGLPHSLECRASLDEATEVPSIALSECVVPDLGKGALGVAGGAPRSADDLDRHPKTTARPIDADAPHDAVAAQLQPVDRTLQLPHPQGPRVLGGLDHIAGHGRRGSRRGRRGLPGPALRRGGARAEGRPRRGGIISRGGIPPSVARPLAGIGQCPARRSRRRRWSGHEIEIDLRLGQPKRPRSD